MAASESDRRELAQKVLDGRKLYRRGYSMIDAASNVGLAVEQLEPYITRSDDKANSDVWSFGPGYGWS